MTIEKTHDPNRRKLLAVTLSAGGVGAVATAIPFVESMQPSERAKAAGAPVEVDLNTVAPGALTTVEFRGKPIWILHRTDDMLKRLGGHDALLADPRSERSVQPDYAKNPVRALKPPYFIATAICTHLGCIPSFRPEPGAPDIGADWPGGFYCPCHGSRFDLAGRVVKNVPAPINLEIPPYTYLSETRVLVGKDKDSV